MATRNLGTLVLDLIAKVAGFETDMGRAARIAQQRSRQMRDAFDENFGAITKRVVAFSATYLSATAVMGKFNAVIDRGDELNKMSQRIGVATDQLSKLAYSADLAGVDLNTLQNGIVQLNKRAAEALQGNEKYARTFEALGIAIKDSQGNLRDVDVVLEEVADAFQTLGDSPERAKLAVDLFGKAGAQLIPMLKDGSAGLRELGAEAESLGIVFDAQAAANAEIFNDELTKLGYAVDGMAIAVAKDLLPELIELVQEIRNFATEGGTAREIAAFVSREIDGMASGVRALKAEFEMFAAFADKIKATATFDQAAFDDSVRRMEAIRERMNDPIERVGGVIWVDPREQLEAEAAARAKASAATAEHDKKLAALNERLKKYFTDTGAAKRATEEFEKELRENAQAAAQWNSELDQWIRSQEDLAAELEGPIAQAVLAHSRSMEDLQIKLDKGMITTEEATVAQMRYGEQLQRTKDAINAQLTPAQQLIDDLEFEVQLLKMTNEEQRVAIALRQAGAKATAEQHDRIRELHEEMEAGVLSRQRAEEFGAIWTDAIDEVADAWSDWLVDGFDDASDDVMKMAQNLAKRLISFWMQQQIIIPMQQRMSGQAYTGSNTAFGSSVFGDSAGQWMGGNTGMAAAGNYAAAAQGIYQTYDIYRNGPGGWDGAAQGAMSGAAAGTAIMPGIGTVVGAIVGLLAGYFGGGEPTIRVSDRESDATARSRLDDVIGVARDRMPPGTATAFARGIADFDNAIAGIFDSYSGGVEQMERVREALRSWSIRVEGDAATVENVLTERFDAILATFSQDVQDFVNEADTLEDRVQRLADALIWPDEIDNILQQFRDTEMLAGMTEFERGAFQINQTFDALREQFVRMRATTEQLNELEHHRQVGLEELRNSIDGVIAAEEELIEFTQEAAQAYADLVTDMARQIAELDGSSSEFQMSLRDIAAAYLANVDALNQAARAAGLAGAREEDLAQAMQLATLQRARAIAMLEAEGRALADRLGYTRGGEVDEEIARLEALERDAASSVRDFGDAMGEAARAANDSINLLLGDLSPLRDREKLKLAMRAQEEGRIGPEEVLQIARRLFASGDDYNQIFNRVLAIGDRRSSGGGGGDFGGGSISTTSPELAALYAELAQVVADLAGARGEDFGTIAEGLGFELEELMRDLRLDSIGDLTDYLEQLQATAYGIEDIAATITAGDYLIVTTLERLFEQAGGRLPLIDDHQAPPNIPGPTDPDPSNPKSLVIQEQTDTLTESIATMTEVMRELLSRIAAATDTSAEMLRESLQDEKFDTLKKIAARPKSDRMLEGR
jgi:hypothetical protein